MNEIIVVCVERLLELVKGYTSVQQNYSLAYRLHSMYYSRPLWNRLVVKCVLNVPKLQFVGFTNGLKITRRR